MLSAITQMDLSENRLIAIPSYLFAQLPSLRMLDLTKNAIHRLELPSEGANWQSPQLETLFLDDNQLEELPNKVNFLN